MIDYIVLSSTGAIGGGLKMSVSRWDITAIPDTPAVITAGLNGGVRTISTGIGKRRWKFAALIKYSGEASGYATYDQCKAFFDTGTAATNLLKFQDQEGATVWDVVQQNKGDTSAFKPLSRILFALGAWWEIAFDLVQR
jgi:hypothetical protein